MPGKENFALDPIKFKLPKWIKEDKKTTTITPTLRPISYHTTIR
jgi:hypothetical protein